MLERVLAATLMICGLGVVGARADASLVGKSPGPIPHCDAWLNSPGPVLFKDHPGKVFVIEVWATWCGPCQQTIPHFQALYEKYKDQGVIFMGLTGDPLAKVKPVVQQKHMTYPVGVGEKGDHLKIDYIPQAFVIGKNGKVLWVGYFDDIMKNLDAEIAKANR